MKPYSLAKILFLLVFYLFLVQINLFAGPAAVSGPQYPSPNVRQNATKLTSVAHLQTFDVSALNLKNTEQHSVQQTTSAVSISLADFNTISEVGNSWLFYHSMADNFSMNIGTANNASAQTWTLPANFMSYFQGAGRSDFIIPSNVPAALQIAGSNKVMRTYYLDDNGHPMKVYEHFDVNSTIINHLGTSYDLEDGEDDNFNEPDYELTDVPLDLDDSFISTIEEEDYVTNLSLIKYVQNQTVDGYGTISTPDGIFNCLRLSIVNQKYTRATESSAYSLVSTENRVAFMTKEGQYLVAKVSATSGMATLSDIQYRKVVATALFSETNDVKLNNDNKGVTININNDYAHPSAILDIKNDSLGVLIPRIAKANRPHSPATGLLVYQIDNTPGFYYFDGSAWRVLGSSPSARIAADENSFSINGTTQLSNGSTFIKFDQVHENPENLIIQIQPEDDCNGLYISQKTKDGFWVKELQKGKSNVKFSYSVKLN